ncbi:ABC transporter permease subunit [candidate division KSB1 bacterium]|nr:ABC transporter permease subunit [candidate division KSB1 bacterium]
MVNKSWTIFKREYLTRVKTRGFVIGTIIGPVLLLLISIGPGFLMNLQSEKEKNISVVDLSGVVYEKLDEAIDDTTETGSRIYQFKEILATESKLDSVKSTLRTKVDQNEIDAFLVIPPDAVDKNESEYYAKNVSNFEENSKFRSAISGIITEYRLKQSEIDPALIDKLTKRVHLRTFKISRGGKEQEDIGLSFVVTFVMIFFLYFMLIMYGALVMRSVYEEKLSRVVEVIISSCKPFQLMTGKVLGVGGVGMTQFLIWVGAAALLGVYSQAIIGMFFAGAADVVFPHIPVSVLVYFVLYFLLGFILYATLYAGLGALVSTEAEAQQLQFPVLFMIIFAFIFAFYIIRNPNTDLSIVISMIPFFAPITMFTRIATMSPPFSEILLSLALLVGTIILLLWLAGKIFRIGILMYGKRPTLPELLNWIRY